MFANWYAEINLFSLTTFLPLSTVTVDPQKKIESEELELELFVKN